MAPAQDAARLQALERENAELRRAVGLLHQIGNLVRESLELEPTCYAVLTGVTAGVGLGLNRALLFLVDDEERTMLRGVAAVGPADAEEADRVWRSIESNAPGLSELYRSGLSQRAHPGPLDRVTKETRVSVEGDTPIALALRRGELVRGEGSDDLGGLLSLETALAAPLRGADRVRGVLYGDNRFTGKPLDKARELVFSLIADHAGRAIEQAHHYEHVARQARTDALTELEHHGRMMEAARSAIAQARSSAEPLGLAMLDLDDFKRVNDTYGHLAGDALLAGVAARLRGVLRAGQTPYRYGGEEFAVLLPSATHEALASVGERLRTAVAEHPFTVDAEHTLQVTCSVGMASLAPDDDAAALIHRADQALLLAKSSGKNRVVVAPAASSAP
ncbi:MAG: sensor domain-containing diguanylate cyclase [Polyangiaceae bacterium]